MDEKNVYVDTVVKTKIYLLPREFHAKTKEELSKAIENKLISMYEGVCISDGYVKVGSIRLVKRSRGKLNTTTFKGLVQFDVEYAAEICNPLVGNVVIAKVKEINSKIGLLAEASPMEVTIIKDYHEDLTIFDKIKVDDTIYVEILAKRFKLNNKYIEVVGKIVKNI